MDTLLIDLYPFLTLYHSTQEHNSLSRGPARPLVKTSATLVSLYSFAILLMIPGDCASCTWSRAIALCLSFNVDLGWLRSSQPIHCHSQKTFVAHPLVRPSFAVCNILRWPFPLQFIYAAINSDPKQKPQQRCSIGVNTKGLVLNLQKSSLQYEGGKWHNNKHGQHHHINSLITIVPALWVHPAVWLLHMCQAILYHWRGVEYYCIWWTVHHARQYQYPSWLFCWSWIAACKW
jgi:hypothetical protein